MQRTSKTLFLAGCLSVAAACAQAESLYAGFNTGAPDYSRPINGTGQDGGPSGYAVDVYGGYRITPHLALETGFSRLGHSSSAAGTVRTRTVYLDGVGSLSLTPALSALARVGVAETHFLTSLGNDSGPALKVGAGLQYDLGNQFAVRAEVDHYQAHRAFGEQPHVGEMVVGLNLHY
jgi:OOP family OmpA-OmpF porin